MQARARRARPPEATGVQAREAFDDFFLDALSLMQPLPLPPALPPASDNPGRSKADLIEARRDMRAAREDNLHALARWNVVHPRAVKAEVAAVLLRAGCKVRPQDYELASATVSDATAALATALEADRRIVAALEPFQDAAARRLTLALELLPCEPVARRLAGGPARVTGADTLYPTAAYLAHRVVAELPALMRAQQVTGHLLVSLSQGTNGRNDRFLEGCLDACQALSARLQSFRQMLAAAPATILFNEQGNLSLTEYAKPSPPGAGQPVELVQAAEHAIDQLSTLYRHTLGRLAVTAEEVEKAVGLPPLERAAGA